ncbi:hypothetical protein J6TS1_19220 [Siminovitchia terrae]|uniref:Uncharacterized protein n=1 Tax=Siminovitchia terrae TaxID=1914933 RepID=A0ABQ4KXQ1_SIMTE|nr:hypothetical protein [Siminovitchia terrae]GIN96052.1 hypothetical protein J6TS1_19220 [Siminovitchia terrae]
MTKNNVLVFGVVVFATILGIYGQDIAYFFNDNVAKIYPIYYLSAITLISIFLYLVALLVTYLSYKKKIVDKGKFVVYLSTILIIGLPTSFWSNFVLLMWWG